MTVFQGLESLAERGPGLKKSLIFLNLHGLYPSRALKLIQDAEEWEKVRPHRIEEDARYRHWMALEEQGYWTLCLDEPAYPSSLLQLGDPPPLLFGRGDPTCLNRFCLAQIGTRKASVYGQKYGRQIAWKLAEKGAVIVSGLANGIDSIGHRAALDAGGKTIAVLGTAIDSIYPIHHQALAEQIIQQGCIISEYGPGYPTHPFHFLERNRIISGLAQGVIIIEAGTRSGTINTAHHAGEQGRNLFCLPGNVDLPRSAGTNWLIQQGAMLITGADDVLQAYPLQWPEEKEEQTQKLEALTQKEQALYAKLLDEPLSIDQMLLKTRLQPSELWLLLTRLEELGLVELNSMNAYQALAPKEKNG